MSKNYIKQSKKKVFIFRIFFFFFLETNTHTHNERENGSNIKAQHNSTQKPLNIR